MWNLEYYSCPINKEINEYIEQLIQFVILSKFGYMNVENHFNYIENLNKLNNELTTILRSEFAYISNDMYNNLFGNLFDVVNTWKKIIQIIFMIILRIL